MFCWSSKRQWPLGRGFERYYGFLGGETNQWYPDLIHDNHPVQQPKSPEEGHHLSADLTDKAIEFVQDAKAIAPNKPFFVYYSPCRDLHGRDRPTTKGPNELGIYYASRETELIDGFASDHSG
jgi:arylsulfatase A-like enzyme